MSAKELAAKFQQQLNEKEANQKVLSGEHHASGGGAAGGGGAGAERRSSGSVKNAAAMFQQQLNDKEANQVCVCVCGGERAREDVRVSAPSRACALAASSRRVIHGKFDEPEKVKPNFVVAKKSPRTPATADTAPTPSSPTPARAPARACLLYTSPSPRDRTRSRMPSSA